MNVALGIISNYANVVIQPYTAGIFRVLRVPLGCCVRLLSAFSRGCFMKRPLLLAELADHRHRFRHLTDRLDPADRDRVHEVAFGQIKIFAVNVGLRTILKACFWEYRHDPLAQNVHERRAFQMLRHFLLGFHPLVELTAWLVVLRGMAVRAKRYQIEIAYAIRSAL